ncbi:MAG: hypothetical protein FRX48_03752 [Lasallia pustulata]|uniref:Uncharacterized protein n=1 Tax=Lasallia pustulata TaxID=136370 RepID=A0A5M8PT43_9LECA|nr:MAG: hypothetical protein FRX48_03752 [Lasallia pustulata]
MDRDSPPNQPRNHGNKWQHQGKYKAEHGKSGGGRATAQDWFEDNNPHLGPSKEKTAWNIWVAPKAKTPERRFSNPPPASNHTINGSDDPATANCPQIHPDRLRLWSDDQSEVTNGSSKKDPLPPTLLRENRELDEQRNGTHERSSTARDTGHTPLSDKHSRSAERNRSHLSPLITEPRRTDQAHHNNHLSSASSKGTPGSTAMDVDDPNPFRRHSSNRSAAASTHKTTMSLPPPPRPNLNTEDSQNKMNYLVKTLGQFTSAITSLASANVQRELAEKKVTRQKSELDRWQKHHSSFTSLAEEHEREMEKARSTSYLMDMKLKEHEALRDETIQAMATTMLTNGNVAVSNQEEDKRIRRMQSDLTDLRSEMNENMERLRSIQYEPSHVKSLALKQSEGFKDLKRAMHDLEKRAVTKQHLVELDNHYVSRNSFLEMEERVNNRTSEWSKIQSSLTEQVDKLKEQMDSLSSLKLEADQMEERVIKLDGTVRNQGDTLRILDHVISGENSDQGLLDLVNNFEQDVNRFRGTLKTFNEEIGTLSEDAHKQVKRIEELELVNSMRDKSSVDADLHTTVQNMTNSVTALSEDLAQLKAEQESKDELIGQESERLDISLQALQSQVTFIRSDFEATISRVNLSLSDLQSCSVPTAPVPTPQALPDPTARTDGPLLKELARAVQDHQRALKRHYDKLQVIETFQISLSQRFDNLTTERLAQNMVHQMQKMWPNAAEVKADVDHVKEREGQLKMEVDGLTTALEAVQRRIEAQDLSRAIKDQKDQLVAFALKCEKLCDSTGLSVRNLQTAIESLDNELGFKVKELSQDAQQAKEFFAEVSDQLRLDVEKINKRVDILEDTNVGEIATLYGEVMELKTLYHHESQVSEKDGPQSTIVLDSDGTGRNPNDHALPIPDKGSTTEQETVAQPENRKMRRSKLVTKKEKKRKRVSSSDTEGDDRSKRRDEEI